MGIIEHLRCMGCDKVICICTCNYENFDKNTTKDKTFQDLVENKALDSKVNLKPLERYLEDLKFEISQADRKISDWQLKKELFIIKKHEIKKCIKEIKELN